MQLDSNVIQAAENVLALNRTVLPLLYAIGAFEKYKPLIDLWNTIETDVQDSFEQQENRLVGSMVLDEFSHVLGNEMVM